MFPFITHDTHDGHTDAGVDPLGATVDTGTGRTMDHAALTREYARIVAVEIAMVRAGVPEHVTRTVSERGWALHRRLVETGGYGGEYVRATDVAHASAHGAPARRMLPAFLQGLAGRFNGGASSAAAAAAVTRNERKG